MRVRSVNEKAVAKLIAYLTDLRKDLDNGIYVTGHQLQTKHQVSKSSYSVCRKLNIITEDQKWNIFFEADRKTAIKILEYLRQQSDKQSDKPISDLWVSEITHIKSLLTDIRNISKDHNNHSKAVKISPERDRFETARMFASSMVSNREVGSIGPESIDLINQTAISLTDDLLKKLNP